MKRSKEEILASISAFIGENPTDEGLALLEDVTDSFDNDSEDWRAKYETNDKEWRERYKARFTEKIITEEKREEKEEVDEPLTYDNLFKEEKRN